MIHTIQLPTDLQESIWTEYCNGLRYRMSLMHSIRTFCLTDANADYILDWMAHMLQYPSVKPQKGIILVGQPCCGKSLFAELLVLLLGQDNVHQRPFRLGRINYLIEGKRLVRLEDWNIRNRLPQIHQLISDQNITIQRRFQDPYNVPSHHRVLITTNMLSLVLNHSNAFQRFTVIPCGSVFFNTQVFHEAMNDPVKLAELRQHLMQRSVTPDLS